MSDILVLSGAYTSNPDRWAAFRESCEKHKVPTHVLGIGETYPGMGAIANAMGCLQTRSEEYIVATDSYDVICSRWDEDEVRLLIDSAPDLIMSVEPLVWPVGSPDSYPSKDRHKWRAICGGQYAGRREQVIEMWSEMLNRWHTGQESLGGSSQELLHRMQYNRRRFTLDLECRLFQSMIGENAKLIYGDGFGARRPWRGLAGLPRHRAYNTITKTYPMFLHFNGGPGKSPGMEEWRKLLK